MEDLTIKVDGKEYDVKIEETDDGKILVHCNGDVYEVEAGQSKQAAIFSKLKKKEIEEEGKSAITSPLPGIIYDIKIKKGDKIKEGQPLIMLVAMKMENEIAAPRSGTIKEINVKKNDNVNKGDILVVIE